GLQRARREPAPDHRRAQGQENRRRPPWRRVEGRLC
ncbi:MAG: Flagellar motor rotation protein MotB, partial [uncultured Sphingomonadaceae bacterium]